MSKAAGSGCVSNLRTRPCWRAPPRSARPDQFHPARRAVCAKAVITEYEKLRLSERDSLRVLDLLENSPEPAARLVRAAKAGFILE
jgi:hypothetical protein